MTLKIRSRYPISYCLLPLRQFRVCFQTCSWLHNLLKYCTLTAVLISICCLSVLNLGLSIVPVLSPEWAGSLLGLKIGNVWLFVFEQTLKVIAISTCSSSHSNVYSKTGLKGSLKKIQKKKCFQDR